MLSILISSSTFTHEAFLDHSNLRYDFKKSKYTTKYLGEPW